MFLLKINLLFWNSDTKFRHIMPVLYDSWFKERVTGMLQKVFCFFIYGKKTPQKLHFALKQKDTKLSMVKAFFAWSIEIFWLCTANIKKATLSVIFKAAQLLWSAAFYVLLIFVVVILPICSNRMFSPFATSCVSGSNIFQ